ncbi:hypothetical protein BGX38DRAFT_397554 [Terfezia claveryi]|nr:hypothetical protein BGX38DRAFT_397554 [Terfezia claveryi]
MPSSPLHSIGQLLKSQIAACLMCQARIRHQYQHWKATMSKPDNPTHRFKIIQSGKASAEIQAPSNIIANVSQPVPHQPQRHPVMGPSYPTLHYTTKMQRAGCLPRKGGSRSEICLGNRGHRVYRKVDGCMNGNGGAGGRGCRGSSRAALGSRGAPASVKRSI